MEQIQQHEWKETPSFPNIFECKYCKCKKALAVPHCPYDMYRRIGRKHYSVTEPACITRTINRNENS